VSERVGGPEIIGRRLAWVVLVAAVVFLFQGGEYSTVDWLELRRQEREEEARVAELERVVDSLERLARAIATDRRTQERIARETFGMIGKGEHLFRLLPPEEGSRADRP
jgi:cell division protein FtsB